jgi:FkbM family methyltransferase
LDDSYEVGCILPSLDRAKAFVDVGCHEGVISNFLADHGFTGTAIEPNPELAHRLRETLRSTVRLLEVAASDHDGHAQLLVGSCAGVGTLEPDWAITAFPEEFRTYRRISVVTSKLSTLFSAIGFLKIDTEGHEYRVLQGLGAIRPDAIMFEANQRFPLSAQQCCSLLRAKGYERFEMFIKCGTKLLDRIQFFGTALPAEWFAHREYFYANIVVS